jgi:hypothetical protein
VRTYRPTAGRRPRPGGRFPLAAPTLGPENETAAESPRQPLRFGRLRNAVLPQTSLEPALIGDDEVGALDSGNASAE